MSALATESRCTLWVGDLAVCDACGDLTNQGVCATCGRSPHLAFPGPNRTGESTLARKRREWRNDPERRRRAHERARRQAKPRMTRDRPFAVLPVPEAELGRWQEDCPSSALLPLPEDLTPSAVHVARAVAHIASMRLAKGDSLGFALRIALGRDLVTDTLAEQGIHQHRSTTARALEELHQRDVIHRIDQLAPETDTPSYWRGAYVYALPVRAAIGLAALISRALRRPRPIRSAAVRCTGLGNRIDGCLTAAVRHAEKGQRNRLGHWLTCRCTDAGLTEDEAMKVMRLFHAKLRDRRGFTLAELERTVRSRYRRVR